MSGRRSRRGWILGRPANPIERCPPRGPDGFIALPDLTGKTILVTGASSGIGRAAALRLAGAGATVLAHGRSRAKVAELDCYPRIEPLVADFSRLREVRRLADDVLGRTGRLDAILHNAGAFYRRRVLTEDGHESTFQTNYLAAFLLQLLLNDLLLATPGSRVVVSTSVASRLGSVDLNDFGHLNGRYRPFIAYATTKLLGIIFVRELRYRFAQTSTRAAAVHPGAVATNFGAGSMLPHLLYRVPVRKELLIGYFVSTPEQGAEPLAWLAARPDTTCGNSLYFNRFVPARPPSPQGDDPVLAREVWAQSEELVREWIAPPRSLPAFRPV